MSLILHIAVPTPLRRLFDYLPPENCNMADLKPGIRVKVPFRHKSCIGILVACDKQSDLPQNKLKRTEEILDKEPWLTDTIFRLALWAADYYQYAIGEVLFACLPTMLRTRETVKDIVPPSSVPWQSSPSNVLLNEGQQQAVNSILSQQDFKTFLIDGVTGSGKTEIYLQIIAQKLQEGKQALVLVPEIGLTPQTLLRFTSRFKAPIVAIHSKLTEKERLQAWMSAKQGHAAIIIGTRSAIFTPLARPGVLIIDEEHDLSFKQQSGFRYSARDCAIMRGHLENFPVILGSATPSLESLYNVTHKRYQALALNERAGNARLPQFTIIDVRKKPMHEGLSPELLNLIRAHLQQNEQVLLFLNRRGFAPLLLCHHCGWMAQCIHCAARLTLHQAPKKLHCHHCEKQFKVPASCPSCQSSELLSLGLGTERLESTLSQLFPGIEIVRIDRDTTRRKGALTEKLAQIQPGKKQILIGTQMLTKGHHFPDVTLVAIVNADHYLFSMDFRASERLGQLLIQVAGRAGRAEKSGTVCIQTHFPTHPLLLNLIEKGYGDFAKNVLQERCNTELPPYSHMAIIRAEAHSNATVQDFLEQAALILKEHSVATEIQLLGPMPSPLEKKAGYYRMQLLVKAKKRLILQHLLKTVVPLLETKLPKHKVRWSLDIDPVEL